LDCKFHDASSSLELTAAESAYLSFNNEKIEVDFTTKGATNSAQAGIDTTILLKCKAGTDTNDAIFSDPIKIAISSMCTTDQAITMDEKMSKTQIWAYKERDSTA
jgi:hypothetical protein